MTRSLPSSSVEPLELSDWHGWRVAGVNLHVGPLPGRKQICLYEQDGSVIRTLAFFKTEEQARKVLTFLDTLAASRFVLDTLEQAA